MSSHAASSSGGASDRGESAAAWVHTGGTNRPSRSERRWHRKIRRALRQVAEGKVRSLEEQRRGL